MNFLANCMTFPRLGTYLEIMKIFSLYRPFSTLLQGKKYMIILAADSPSQNLLQYISQAQPYKLINK